ncbi:hypothetical protein DSL63_00275, partial [Metamycoplasma hominis]
KNNPNYA